MKRIFFVLLSVLLVMPAIAQPPARIREAQKAQQIQQQSSVLPTPTPQAKPKAATSGATTVSQRAELEFPSAAEMPEDVSWRRDIYRVLDLEKDKNAVLYYPGEPQGDRMNLFTYLFKLMMRKQIAVYNYTID